MSVIVKGLEMPGNCYECRFHGRGFCFLTDLKDNGKYPLVEASTLVRRVGRLCSSISCWDCPFCYAKNKSSIGCKLRDTFESVEG